MLLASQSLQFWGHLWCFLETMENSKDKPSSRCKIRDDSHFGEWLDDTPIHGIKHVFKAPSFLRKLLWTIAFSIAAIGLIYNVTARFMFYFEFRTATEVSLDTDVGAIVFPSVTICNLNPVRLSYAKENNLSQLLTHVYSLDIDDAVCKDLARTHTLRDKTLRNILYEGRMMLDDFVLGCIFAGSDGSLYDCKKNLSLTLTNLGYCYSFNSDPAAKVVTVSNSGARYGLGMVLDIDQENYLPVLTGAGVRVMIQPRGVPPEPDERGVLIPPGEEGLIELRTQIIKDSSTRRRCMERNTELSFFRGYNYSLGTCRLQKAFELVADECNCIDIVDNLTAISSDLPNCTVADLCCAYATYFDINEGSCTESCNYVEYKVTTSYSQFPSRASLSSLAYAYELTPERIKNDVVAVDIYFGDPHSRTISTKDAFTAISLLSNIGGQLGLFMGISIIALVEVGLLTVDELMDILESCFRRKVH